MDTTIRLTRRTLVMLAVLTPVLAVDSPVKAFDVCTKCSGLGSYFRFPNVVTCDRCGGDGQTGGEVQDNRTKETPFRVHNRTNRPAVFRLGFKSGKTETYIGHFVVSPGQIETVTLPATSLVWIHAEVGGQPYSRRHTNRPILPRNAYRLEVNSGVHKTWIGAGTDRRYKGEYGWKALQDMGFEAVMFEERRINFRGDDYFIN